MTWWFWDAVYLLSSLSYRQQRWTEAASPGTWGASLALGPGTKPVLDGADLMDRSALACLSAGCLSPLCTVQEEVNPLVCQSYQTLRSTETSLFEAMCWVVSWCLGVGVYVCLHVLELHFLLAEFQVMNYLSHGLNYQGKSLWQTRSCSRFSLKLKTLMLFLNL